MGKSEKKIFGKFLYLSDMNLQEQTNRIRKMMGLHEDTTNTELESVEATAKGLGGSLRDVELTMRRPEKNEIIFVSVEALLEKHAKDQPSYDITKPEIRMKGRVEKAKEFIKNYIKDQRIIDPKTGERMKYKVSFEPSVVDIDANGKISFEDGRHRVLAAKELGLTEVPIEVPKGSVKAIESILNKEVMEINNPQTDEYNDILVNGVKVGYIILSPARKEYYWVDVNLPNPLAIVDIKIYNEFRGKQYMKKTMNWLCDFAKENGYKSLFLRVDDDSEISQEILIQIYQKFGFLEYETADDNIFMYKLL